MGRIQVRMDPDSQLKLNDINYLGKEAWGGLGRDGYCNREIMPNTWSVEEDNYLLRIICFGIKSESASYFSVYIVDLPTYFLCYKNDFLNSRVVR